MVLYLAIWLTGYARPMSSRVRLLLLVPLLALSALPAKAVTVEDLYTASLAVADKSGEVRREAFRDGLERVLVKVAGTPAVLAREGVDELLESPAPFVQQYRYAPIERETDDRDAAAGAQGDGEPGPRFRLIATFAGGRIEQRLKALDVVVWGRQRPEILVWLAVDDARARRILAADGASQAHGALRAAAERRALPVLLPVMDASDRSRVEFVDISGGFHDTVGEASQRYRADITLVGHVRRSGSGWRADWTLLGLGQRRAWSATEAGIAAAVATGIDGATDRLASVLAGEGGERRSVEARVLGVASLADYARVSEYFRGLVRVEAAHLRRAEADALAFAVTIQGRVEAFERAVALGDTLVRAPNAVPDAGADSGEGAAQASAVTGSEASAAATGEPGDAGDTAARRVPELVFRLAD